jgi:hypothetical protein
VRAAAPDVIVQLESVVAGRNLPSLDPLPSLGLLPGGSNGAGDGAPRGRVGDEARVVIVPVARFVGVNPALPLLSALHAANDP